MAKKIIGVANATREAYNSSAIILAKNPVFHYRSKPFYIVVNR